MTKTRFKLTPPTSGIIGHRGIAGLAPENTMASFQMAAQNALEWVELDMRLTQDEHLIIFHDDTLDRTTNGGGFVHEKTLTELIGLDAGSWFDKEFKDEKIPVFSEVLPKLHHLNLNLNIEIKLPANHTQQHEQALKMQFVQLMKNYWPANRPLPLVSCFYWPILHEIRQEIPLIPLGFLTEKCDTDIINLIANIPNCALHCNYQHLSDVHLALANQLELPVLAYTVNDPQIANRLLESGVFAIFSDHLQEDI